MEADCSAQDKDIGYCSYTMGGVNMGLANILLLQQENFGTFDALNFTRYSHNAMSCYNKAYHIHGASYLLSITSRLHASRFGEDDARHKVYVRQIEALQNIEKNIDAVSGEFA